MRWQWGKLSFEVSVLTGEPLTPNCEQKTSLRQTSMARGMKTALVLHHRPRIAYPRGWAWLGLSEERQPQRARALDTSKVSFRHEMRPSWTSTFIYLAQICRASHQKIKTAPSPPAHGGAFVVDIILSFHYPRTITSIPTAATLRQASHTAQARLGESPCRVPSRHRHQPRLEGRPVVRWGDHALVGGRPILASAAIGENFPSL